MSEDKNLSSINRSAVDQQIQLNLQQPYFSKRLSQRKSTFMMKTQNIEKKEYLKKCVQKIREATQVKNPFQANIQVIHDLASSQNFSENPIHHQDQIENQLASLYHASLKSNQTPFQKLVYQALKFKKKLKNNTLINFYNTTIKASNPFMIIWNFFKIFIILHCFLSFFLEDAFTKQFQQLEANIYSELIKFEFFFLIVDILFHFNTQHYYKGELITNRSQISKLYIKKGLFVDIVSLSAFLLNRSHIIFNLSDNFILPTKYLFFLQFKSLKKFFKFLLHELDPKNTYKSYFELIKLLLHVCMMAHIIACIWIVVANQSQSYYNNTWISSNNLNEQNWYSIYIISVYFACMTMTTVGYGDILPQNDVEYVACICVILFSCGMFAYTFNTITSILNEINSKKDIYKKELELVNQHIHKKKIGNEIEKKVKNYLKTKWKSGHHYSNQQEIFAKLTQTLQHDILIQDKGKILIKVPFLSKNFTLDFIKSLMKEVVEMHHQPEEQIQDDLQGLFIVYQGEAELLHNNKQIGIIKQGEVFGQISIFKKPYKNLKIRCKDFTILYYIPTKDFLKLINCSSNRDFENFNVICSQVLNNNNTQRLYLKCCICGKNHDLQSCQDSFFQPQKKICLAKYHKTKSERIYQERKKKQKFRSRKNWSNLKETIQLHQEQFQDSYLEQRLSIDENLKSKRNTISQEEDEESNQSWKGQIDEEDAQSQMFQKLLTSKYFSFQSSNEMNVHQDQFRKSEMEEILKQSSFYPNSPKFKKNSQLNISQKQLPILKQGSSKIASQQISSEEMKNKSQKTNLKIQNSDAINYSQNPDIIDRLCSYKYYYPIWNIEKVIESLKKKKQEKKSISIQRKKQRFI